MLTGYQAEIVAFVGDGELYHRECVHDMRDEGEFAQADMGLGDLSPLSRYSIDEWAGEEQWERAEQRIIDLVAEYVTGGDWSAAYSVVASWKQYDDEGSRDPRSQYRRFHALLDRLAEDKPGVVCGKCGEEIN